jgi:hypothetical protein
MAEGIDATIPPEHHGDGETTSLPVVTVLKCPSQHADIENWDTIVEQARHALSFGFAVAITGDVESGPKYKWDERSLSDIASCNTNGGYIQWQCNFPGFSYCKI